MPGVSPQPTSIPSHRYPPTLNASTKMKEGTATRGCGRHVATLQRRARRGVTPCPTSTVALARPSGMLCTPMASVVSTPCSAAGTAGTACRDIMLAVRGRKVPGLGPGATTAMQSGLTLAWLSSDSSLLKEPPRPQPHLRPAAVAAEGDANSAALAQGMRRHDPNHQHSLAGCTAGTRVDRAGKQAGSRIMSVGATKVWPVIRQQQVIPKARRPAPPPMHSSTHPLIHPSAHLRCPASPQRRCLHTPQGAAAPSG